MSELSKGALIGIDVGTTNLKAVGFDLSGQTLAQSIVATPRSHPQAGWTDWDPWALENAIMSALAELVAKLGDRRPLGIAVASVAESVVGVDHSGEPVGPFIAWHDSRSEAETAVFRPHAPEFATIAGVPIDGTFSLCKLLWEKEHRPENYSRAQHWLPVADYVAYRLCGVMAVNAGLASRTLGLDLRRVAWSERLFDLVGLSPELFPPVTPSGTRLNTIRPEVGRRCGLPESTVVAVGGHDHLCGALAAGVRKPGTILDSIGTSEALYAPVFEPASSTEFTDHGFCSGVFQVVNEAPSYFLMSGMPSAGECFEWLDRLLGPAPPGEHAPGEILFIPHLRFDPHDQLDRRPAGAFLRLGADSGPADLWQAVREGVAFEIKLVAERMRLAAGLPKFERVRGVGKAFTDPAFRKIKTALNGQIEFRAEFSELAAWGAAILAGLAAGVYQSAEEAAVSDHWIVAESQPEERESYERAFASYWTYRASVENARELADINP